MCKLLLEKSKMLNPIVTKLLQINQIYFSKSFSHFSVLGSLDPDSHLTQKMITRASESKGGDKLLKKMTVIDKAQVKDQVFDQKVYESVNLEAQGAQQNFDEDDEKPQEQPQASSYQYGTNQAQQNYDQNYNQEYNQQSYD